jgi:hypothetical protein
VALVSADDPPKRPRRIPEDGILNNHRRGNLKSYKLRIFQGYASQEFGHPQNVLELLVLAMIRQPKLNSVQHNWSSV